MNRKQQQQKRNFWWDFLSGGIAGIISKTVVAPIQRVKLLMQTQRQNKKVQKPYKGTLDCFIRCYKEDGVLAFWRGNWANVVRYFPTQALSFSFKDYFNTYFDPNIKRTKMEHLRIKIMSGGLAGAFTTLFVHPLDFVRTRLGVDLGKNKEQRQFRGLSDCFIKTFKSQGIPGLYKGLVVSVPSIFVYRGLYFGLYDTGKDLFFGHDSNIFVRFFWAQFSVIFSQTLSYPGDTVKRKLMMQSMKKQKQYSGAIDCFAKVYRSQGLPGLWRGVFTNMFRSVGSSLCLVLYDQFVKSQKKSE